MCLIVHDVLFRCPIVSGQRDVVPPQTWRRSACLRQPTAWRNLMQTSLLRPTIIPPHSA